MVMYKCFSCGKEINSDTLRKRVRCIYCGAKMLYKIRSVSKTLKAE